MKKGVFSDNCRYFLVLYQRNGRFLKVSYNAVTMLVTMKPYKPTASVTLKAAAHCMNLLSIHNFLLYTGHLENIGSLLHKPSKCHHIPLYTIKKNHNR